MGKDFAEKPAEVAAIKVAKILESRGHEVALERMHPRSNYLSLLSLGDKLRQADLNQFEVNLRTSHNWLERMAHQAHLISFHNTNHEYFLPRSRRAIHRYSATFHEDTGNTYPGNPVSIVVREKNKYQLSAVVELPAIAVPFKGKDGKKFVGASRKAKKIVDKDNDKPWPKDPDEFMKAVEQIIHDAGSFVV